MTKQLSITGDYKVIYTLQEECAVLALFKDVTGLKAGGRDPKYFSKLLYMEFAEEYPDHDPLDIIRRLIQLCLTSKNYWYTKWACNPQKLKENWQEIILAEKVSKDKSTIKSF